MAFDAPPLALDTALRRIRRLREHPVAQALADAAEGTRALLVGGAPRDAALGRRIGDFDAIVASDGARIAERLARALGGRAIELAPGRFAALRVAAPDIEIDLWDLLGGDLAPDLARRDLTVNAIALDLASGEVLDPHDGLGDLARRVLRAIGPDAFAADPLRVLRLARLVVTLDGFGIAAETAKLARTAVPGLDGVAGERIRDELVQLAAGAPAGVEQRALEEVGAYPALWGSRGAVDERCSATTVFDHYDRARRTLGPERGHPGDLAARHALRLVACGAPAPLERLDRLAERSIVSRTEARATARILELPASSPPPLSELAIWVARFGPLWSAAFAAAAAAAPRPADAEWDACLRAVAELVARRGEQVVAPRPLLDGREVASLLGAPTGPAIGRALAALVEAQLAERVRTPEEARRFLKEVYVD